MRRVSVFGPLACLDVLSRLDVGLRCYGKTLLFTGFVGALGSDVCQHCQICYQTSPNQTRIGKRRIKTILDHFSNGLAREAKKKILKETALKILTL